MGWIGRQIACQMMKTADYLAVTPSFSAHALLARGSCGEWEPRRSCRSPGPIAFPSCCFFVSGYAQPTPKLVCTRTSKQKSAFIEAARTVFAY